MIGSWFWSKLYYPLVKTQPPPHIREHKTKNPQRILNCCLHSFFNSAGKGRSVLHFNFQPKWIDYDDVEVDKVLCDGSIFYHILFNHQLPNLISVAFTDPDDALLFTSRTWGWCPLCPMTDLWLQYLRSRLSEKKMAPHAETSQKHFFMKIRSFTMKSDRISTDDLHLWRTRKCPFRKINLVFYCLLKSVGLLKLLSSLFDTTIPTHP